MQVFGLPDLGIRNARQVATLAALRLNRHRGAGAGDALQLR